MTRIVNIFVRDSSGAYLARGEGKTCSCTSDALYAVQRVAMKIAGHPTDFRLPGFIPFSQTGITVTQVTKGQYQAVIPEAA